jgi:hypothetical protein
LAGAADDAVLSSLDDSRAMQDDDPENNGKDGPKR